LPLSSMALLPDLLSDPRYAVAALVLLATLLILLKSSWSRSSSDEAILETTTKLHQTYTLAQVSEHNSKEDAWIVIDGGVYDITPYVTEHPGGVKAILRNAGGDATKGFKGPQHPARVFDMIDDYKIGTVVDSPSS
jgi:cytochrome b involved in lipid metabolism